MELLSVERRTTTCPATIRHVGVLVLLFRALASPDLYRSLMLVVVRGHAAVIVAATIVSSRLAKARPDTAGFFLHSIG
jgi:hypothetical protein